MRLYLDQMFRTELADILRNNGHDVVRAGEVDQSRADDAEIMARIIEEGRTLHWMNILATGPFYRWTSTRV